MYYISFVGNYYEGDKISDKDTLVTKRPSQFHTWSDGSWSFDDTIVNTVLFSDINKAAGMARLRYASSIPFQDSVYQFKAVEADAVMAMSINDRPEDGEGYPFIASYLSALRESDPNTTITTAASGIAAIRDSWYQLAAATETLREVGKAKVANADTYEEKAAICNTYINLLNSI